MNTTFIPVKKKKKKKRVSEALILSITELSFSLYDSYQRRSGDNVTQTDGFHHFQRILILKNNPFVLFLSFSWFWLWPPPPLPTPILPPPAPPTVFKPLKYKQDDQTAWKKCV